MRPAEPADAPSIARLVNAAFQPERFFIDADRTSPEKISALIKKGRFILLFEADQMTGSVYAELRGDRGYFGLLAVDPKHQRCGIGGRLIAAADDYCRSAGCKFIDLTFVNVRRELSGYYQRFGYKDNGVLPFPPEQKPNRPVHLVLMSKSL